MCVLLAQRVRLFDSIAVLLHYVMMTSLRVQIQEIVDLHHHPHGHTSGAAEMPPRNKSAPQILLGAGGARHNGANRQWSLEDSPPACADAADDNANLEVPSNSVRTRGGS